MRIEEAYNSLYSDVDRLIDEWDPYITAIKQGADVSDTTIATTAVMLENAKRYMERLTDTTQTGDISGFIKHGFQMISAVMPSLIANDIVSVQPLTRRVGEVFFLEFLYGTTKGKITKGDVMFGANSAGNLNTTFSSETVSEETLATGDGVTTSFTATLSYLPVRPYDAAAGYRVIISDDAGQTLSDDGVGAFVGNGSGTINYTTGAIAVTFTAAPANGAVIAATYQCNFEENPSNIPEVDLRVTSAAVKATNRKLRARNTVDASYDLKMAFGRSAESDLLMATSSEIRQEIDGEIMGDLLTSASAGAVVWDKNTPGPAISYHEHKNTFPDKIVEASNAIMTATRRGEGSFVVAGMEVMNIIEALGTRFVREGSVQPGPHYAGMLDNRWRIYKNPMYPAQEFLVGHKGQMFIEAGYVYAPYLPIYATPSVTLDDFVTRRGLMTSYGKKFVNSKFYAKGSIII